jgi:hypothetical protein
MTHEARTATSEAMATAANVSFRALKIWWANKLMHTYYKYTSYRKKALFDPHRLPVQVNFADESGNQYTLFKGKWHVQNKNRKRSPWSQT